MEKNDACSIFRKVVKDTLLYNIFKFFKQNMKIVTLMNNAVLFYWGVKFEVIKILVVNSPFLSIMLIGKASLKSTIVSCFEEKKTVPLNPEFVNTLFKSTLGTVV